MVKSDLKLSVERGEVVEVNDVLWHVCGQDEVYDAPPHEEVVLPAKVLENVDPVVWGGQLETQRRVMVLQNRDVIVKFGKGVVWIAKECTEKKGEKSLSSAGWR